MALIERQLIYGPGYSIAVVEDDVAHTWTQVHVTNTTGFPLTIKGTYNGIPFSVQAPSATAKSVPLPNVKLVQLTVARTGEVVWAPSKDWSLGASCDRSPAKE